MNVLFLTLFDFDTFEQRNIYTDLLREFVKNNANVYCVSPIERRAKKDTHLIEIGNNKILKLKIGNIQRVKFIEKGISTVMIEYQFINGIKKYFSDVKFDLILYSTPPITFYKAIRYVKERDSAKTYLLLKDIFPQNSVDLGMLSKNGIKGFIYRHFRKREKILYRISDKIGCMSEANCQYLVKHNPEIFADKVEVCPNSIEPQDFTVSKEEKVKIRERYGLPTDKRIFVYGGNFGRPQCVKFIVESLKKCAETDNAYFVIAGGGTDMHIFEKYMNNEKPKHIKMLGNLPKEEYDRMIACCDVGLIFLDYRFTIPNFPSRLLSYMQAGLPVLAATDRATDVGKVITEGGFGFWCESNNAEDFYNLVSEVLQISDLTEYGERATACLHNNYCVEKCYERMVSLNEDWDSSRK